MSNVVKLIEIPAPADIFDAEDVVIFRRKRITVARVDAVRSAQTSEDVYKNLAVIFPKWENVLDAETGEPLPNPEDDYLAFSRLDSIEQLPWFSEQMNPNAGNRGKGRR